MIMFRFRANNMADVDGRQEDRTDRFPAKQQVHSNYDTMVFANIDHVRCRYPFCIVWTPIPCLTWMFPFIGHLGIAMSSGVIRDFAGPYFVSEDDMAFGRPTKYWELLPDLASGGQQGWDRAISDASEEYKHRMHNLLCDNCHSHVSMALNQMRYKGCSNWNMVNVCLLMLINGKFVSIWGFLKTWIPFFILLVSMALLVLILKFNSWEELMKNVDVRKGMQLWNR